MAVIWWSFFIWNYFTVSKASECRYSPIKTWKWNIKKRKEEQETLAIDANILFQYWLFHGRNSYNLCKLIFSPYSGWVFLALFTEGGKMVHTSVTYILHCWNLTQLHLKLRRSKNISITWHTSWVLLTSAFFQRKSANICYIKTYSYKLQKLQLF